MLLRLVPALVALSLGAGSARAAEPLRLEDAVRLTLANNERAPKAALRVTAAEGQLARARSSFLPTLTASGSVSTGVSAARSGRALSGVGTLTLTQPLVTPSAFPLYGQARHSLESERWGASEDKRVLAYDAARAFLVVLTNQQLLDAARRRLELARANHDNTEARAKAQLASSNDLTLAKVDLASASRDVTQAQATVTTSYLQLGYLVGRPVVGPLIASESTTRTAQTAAFEADRLARDAQTRRPDLRSARESTLAAQDGAREPLYRLAPSLSLQGQITVTPDASAPDPLHDETAQLTLSWTLFDAGVRYADRRTLVAQAQSTALDERALRRAVATDVAVSLTALKAARDILRVSEEGVAAATKNVDEVAVLYKQGLSRAIEVVDANARRYDAEVTRATALLAMQQAYLDLRFVVGLEPVDAVHGGSIAGPPKAP